MHSHILWVIKLSIKSPRLMFSQLLQPWFDHLSRPSGFGESPIKSKMACFARQQVSIQLAQLWIWTVLSQQSHALMGARFDQAGYKK